MQRRVGGVERLKVIASKRVNDDGHVIACLVPPSSLAEALWMLPTSLRCFYPPCATYCSLLPYTGTANGLSTQRHAHNNNTSSSSSSRLGGNNLNTATPPHHASPRCC